MMILRRYFKEIITFIIVLCVCTIMVLWEDKTQESEGAFSTFSGCGTKENPYLIASKDDLIELEVLCNSGNDFDGIYFCQTEDIDMQGEKTNPIGMDDNVFNGIYNGNGHTILNLYVDASKGQYAGLFGNLGGIVANLGINNGTINGEYCGGIAGAIVDSEAMIINCFSLAQIRGTCVGNIVGIMEENAKIICSYGFGELEGETMGGIVGWSNWSMIVYSYTDYPELSCDKAQGISNVIVPNVCILESDFVNKMNMKIAIAQEIYAVDLGFDLNGVDFDNGRFVATRNRWKTFIKLISCYLLPILLLIIILYYFLSREKKASNTLLLIGFVVALFVDCSMPNNINCLNVGNFCFIVEINYLFFLLIMRRKKADSLIRFCKENILFLCCALLIGIIAVVQFKILPCYDGALYYGSFTMAVKNFRLNLFSFLGSFICWKNVHGLALFLAPFEFVCPGVSLGVYIGNTFICILTMYYLYNLLLLVFPKLNKIAASFLCLAFMLFPYGMGMFTYFSTDYQLALFVVWLMYGLLKEDIVLSLFAGVLLSFTKDTGAIYYCIFIFIFFTIKYARIFRHEKNIRGFFKEGCIYVIPLLLYVVMFLLGGRIQNQLFVGAYHEDVLIKVKTGIPLYNILFQSFIFGFRWLVNIVFIFCLIKNIRKKIKVINSLSYDVIYACFAASFATVVMLIVYNGLSECPRYTSILNAMYIVELSYSIVTFEKKNIQNIFALIAATIFFAQTYYTIDPSILINNYSIDIGNKKIYKLNIDGDMRETMMIGSGYGLGYECLSDGFAYNMEHTFYSDLYQKMLDYIAPEEDVCFYVLDLMDYEIQINGSYDFDCGLVDIRNSRRQYVVYWDKTKNRRTYCKNQNTINIFETSVLTSQLAEEDIISKMENDFYLIVVPRVDGEQAIKTIEYEGWNLIEEVKFSNIYGMIYVYHFVR